MGSMFEGFSMPMMEAASCGVPTVSTPSSPGVGELFCGTCGYASCDGSVEALSTELLRAMADEQLRYKRSVDRTLAAATHAWTAVVSEAWTARRRWSGALGD